MNNILHAFKIATDDQIARGLKWYLNARDWAAWAAGEYNTSPVIVAGMIAALSPRNRWEWSLQDVIRILNKIAAGDDPTTAKSHTFNSNKLKAIAIAQGHQGLITAQKTSAFCDNIVNPGSRRVTVDVWAWRVYTGEYNARPIAVRGKLYDMIEEKYQAAADHVGLKPYELQAVTWGVARDTGARFNESIPTHTNY